MKRTLWHSILVVLVVLLTGCGGGGTSGNSSSTATGRATMTIHWPATTRLIPLAANSITVTLSQGTQTVATQTVVRPSSGNTATLLLSALPIGTLNVVASAYPNANGTGIAQATATTSIIIQADRNTPFSLTMASTIDHLDISPVGIAVGVYEAALVTVTAKDASGNIVLIEPQTLQWLSSDPTVATVDSAGNVTGVAPGGTTTAVQITVTEKESNKSVSIPVVVSAGVLIAEEHFNYSPGAQLFYQNGGTGWKGNWNDGPIGGSLKIGTDNLTYGNLTTSGSCAVVQQTSLPTGNSRQLASQVGQSGTVVYFSMLLRPLDPIGSATSGSYCALLLNGLYVGKTDAGNSYGMDRRLAGGYVGSQVPAQQNTTVFLVLRATFNAGNDRFDLWVNPVPGQPLPAIPDATKTDLDVGTVTSVGIDASMNAEFDELRVGTSYAAVAPTH
jgi:hypothetical protein